MRFRIILAILALFLLAGCTNLGPRAVKMGRTQYNIVFRETTDEELLLNIVRFRLKRPIGSGKSNSASAFGLNRNCVLSELSSRK